MTGGIGRHWALFADWCTAADHNALPASADTVLAFLTELPAGPATIGRRIEAIDNTHLQVGPALFSTTSSDRPGRHASTPTLLLPPSSASRSGGGRPGSSDAAMPPWSPSSHLRA